MSSPSIPLISSSNTTKFNSFTNVNNSKTKKFMKKYKKYTNKEFKCRSNSKCKSKSHYTTYTTKKTKYYNKSLNSLSTYYLKKVINKLEHYTNKSFFGGYSTIKETDFSKIKDYFNILKNIHTNSGCKNSSSEKFIESNLYNFLSDQSKSKPFVDAFFNKNVDKVTLDFINNPSLLIQLKDYIKTKIKDCSSS